MKKVLSILLSVVMLVSLMATTALAAETYTGKTVILYTGNIHGDVDVYGKVKAAKDSYESKGADVILVDTGNYLSGSAAANTDRGLSIYKLMEATGYDVAAMGLSEFGYTDATTGYIYHGNYTRYYTQAELQNGAEATSYNQGKSDDTSVEREAKEPATFATVASNVTSLKDVYAFSESETVTKSGLSVVFYGVSDPTISENVQDGYVSVSAPTAVHFTDVDVTVCLSNADLESTEGYGDVVISVPDGEFTVGAYVIDNATHEVTQEQVTLSSSDSTVAALASEIKASAGTVIGTSEVILSGADSAGWNGETNLGDLTTDALLWYAKNYIDGIDTTLPIVAIQNGGNCDNFIYTGDITETDLLKALPFSPMGVGVLYVTGNQLLETLEAASQTDDCPGFAQVAGLTYTVDKSLNYDAGAANGKYFEADSVNRVNITSVNGSDFDPDGTYIVVADNFIFNGGDTYYTLENAKNAEGATYINNGTGVKTRDVVALYIKQVLGGNIGEEYAKSQGRITVIDPIFSDVSYNDYFYEAVNWAVENKVTDGTSATTFSPNASCTRGQAVTFLWRAAGSPTPTTTENPFTDISEKDYYYNAVLWAYENGITDGTSATTFTPNGEVTRSQTVTFLWRYAGKTQPTKESSFTDVETGAYYEIAVNWAVENGITDGVGNNSFAPLTICNRGQMVTFLHRYEMSK